MTKAILFSTSSCSSPKDLIRGVQSVSAIATDHIDDGFGPLMAKEERSEGAEGLQFGNDLALSERCQARLIITALVARVIEAIRSEIFPESTFGG